jgi:hypothetical protein
MTERKLLLAIVGTKRNGPPRAIALFGPRSLSVTDPPGQPPTPTAYVQRPTSNVLRPASCVLLYLKLCTRLVMVRLHPSTSTNSSNLKGSEIIAGGSMNMPILISTLATTASMMMNGR